MTTFDLTGPLPMGRVAIEASAGTGKTHTLATLVARYVEETDTTIDEILVVTYTRAAAAELRDRIREHLSARITTADRAPTEAGRRRLEQAVADFDTATISTIHGFAQRMIEQLGALAGGETDRVLQGDPSGLISQVVTDHLARVASLPDGPPVDELPKPKDLAATISRILNNPAARLVPDPDDDAVDASTRRTRQLVDTIAADVARRRRAAGTLGYDDLLTVLRSALAHPVTGRASRELLRQRFRVAMIDEFQDTDPVQWDIFDAAFPRSEEHTDSRHPHTLIVVGDPKQAIYGFRGADVHTYLRATATADRFGLTTNWRSGTAVLSALEALLSGVTFGDERIAFSRVEPSRERGGRHLRRSDGGPWSPLVVRCTESSGDTTDDLVAYVAATLASGELVDGDTARPVRASDIAVLTSSRDKAGQLRDALARGGVPAVVQRGTSVLDSEAVDHWRLLLFALARPADAGRVRAVAGTWFFRRDTTPDLDDAGVELLQEELVDLVAVLDRDGIPALLGELERRHGGTAHLLGGADGERHVTDVEHIGDLLVEGAEGRRGASTLLALLDDLVARPRDDSGALDDPAARRIESDAACVQVMTMHASKGLEFPIVCCPDLASNWYLRLGNVQPVHRAGDDRVIDVCPGVPWPDAVGREARRRAAQDEALGERLRLLYVAMTRAEHHVAVWWTPQATDDPSPLGLVLGHRHRNDVDAGLENLAGATNIEVVRAGPPESVARPSGRRRDATAPTDLAVARLDRDLRPTRTTGRWSFTVLHGRLDAHADGRTPHDPVGTARGADDEFDPDGPDVPLTGRPVGDLAGARGGTHFGNAVHTILEHADFAAADLDVELRRVIDVHDIVPADFALDHATLVRGLRDALETPCGALLGDRPLASFGRADRRDELHFDLGLAEGSQPVAVRAVGDLLLDHLPTADPNRVLGERLRASTLHLAGQLTGSIDLVTRLGDPHRFVIVDYKTNDLTRTGPTPVGADRPYASHRLPAAMAERDYQLQALLYAVALHRFLRLRLAGYRPETHLGGIAYLFVRGMVGSSTPAEDGAPDGVFSWKPPAALITDLSDLLAGTPEGARR